MKLIDAYSQALDEEDDIAEREELSSNKELKTMVIEEIGSAMEETLARIKSGGSSKAEIFEPVFGCVAFFFLIGIRVGKILRDAELAGK